MFYDEEQYEYYEPTVADEIYFEAIGKLKGALNENMKNYIGGLEERENKIKQDLESIKKRESEIYRKNSDLEMKERSLNRDWDKKKLSEMMDELTNQFESSFYEPKIEYTKRPKCSLCNDARRIEIEVEGAQKRKHSVECECNVSDKKYVVEKVKLNHIKVMKDKGKIVYSLSKQSWDRYDDEYEIKRIDKKKIHDEFDDGVEYNMYQGDLFTSIEECQKWADKLNEEK